MALDMDELNLWKFVGDLGAAVPLWDGGDR
jgi:hypothetical protein